MENKVVKYIWGPLRALLHSLPERSHIPVLSVLTGVLCGLAAVLLKVTIRGIHHGLSALAGDATWLFLLLPGVGMLLSFLIVRYLVKDNIGHGVTKVLQAVSKNESKIKRHNMYSSLVTSALTIGFGGSVGAEAPIVYTGAAIGSNLGRYMGLSYRGMTLLLGCGAAGAVAGIFNAPLAGVLFTLEILLFNLSMSSLLPLLLSSASATVVSYLILGRETQFACTLVEFSMRNIPFYLILGAFCGFCSLYFIKTTLWLEDGFGKMKNPWLRWALCAAGVGLLIFFFPPLYGEGYEDVGHLLNGQADGAVWFFALILLLKVFAMTFTNAGGGVGGTFGPTLFVGAIAGYVVASSLNLIHPGLVPVPNFVLVGMAGLMAGVMQAPLTAIFLIAEISGGYELLVPLILTAAFAYGTTRIFERYSIYTKRIAQTGELLTHDSDQAVLTLLKTGDLVETDFTPVRIDDNLGALVDAVSVSQRNVFPVLDAKKRFQGYVDLASIRRDMFRTDLYSTAKVYNYMRSAPEYVHPDEPMDSVMRKFEKTGAWNLPVVDDERRDMFRTDLYEVAKVYNYMRSAPEYVHPDEPMDSVMRKFEKTGAWNLPVVDDDRRYVGFVSKSKIFNAYREELRDFSQD